MNQDLAQIEASIHKIMPLEEFLRIQNRVAWLRQQEEEKLKALAELQKVYVAANSDQEREMVKLAVGQIRELSRTHREELRSLNSRMAERVSLQEAKELYERYLLVKASHNPK